MPKIKLDNSNAFYKLNKDIKTTLADIAKSNPEKKPVRSSSQAHAPLNDRIDVARKKYQAEQQKIQRQEAVGNINGKVKEFIFEAYNISCSIPPPEAKKKIWGIAGRDRELYRREALGKLHRQIDKQVKEGLANNDSIPDIISKITKNIDDVFTLANRRPAPDMRPSGLFHSAYVKPNNKKSDTQPDADQRSDAKSAPKASKPAYNPGAQWGSGSRSESDSDTESSSESSDQPGTRSWDPGARSESDSDTESSSESSDRPGTRSWDPGARSESDSDTESSSESSDQPGTRSWDYVDLAKQHTEACGILGVSNDASKADIRKAYLKLARIYHPDKNSEPNAQEIFKAINNAHEFLNK